MAHAITACAGSCLLANSLLSDEVVNLVLNPESLEIEGGERTLLSTVREETITEIEVVALVEFVAKSVMSTSKAFLARQLFSFDSNPGDDACQSRAAILLDFSHRELVDKELTQLDRQCRTIIKYINKRRSKILIAKSVCPVVDFFKEMVATLSVSREVEFLTHARILKIVRANAGFSPAGTTMTRTDISLFSKVNAQIAKVPTNVRRVILNHSQARHSEQSIEFMHEIAVDPLAKEMMLIENSVRHTKDPFYMPRFFACTLFEVITLFDIIEKRGCFFALKIPDGVDGRFLYLFFRGGKLVDEPDSGSLVVFMEIVPNGVSLKDVAEEIKTVGLREALVSLSSSVEPYQQGSTPDAIVHKAARAEFERIRASPKPTTFLGDHIFLDQVQFERKRTK